MPRREFDSLFAPFKSSPEEQHDCERNRYYQCDKCDRRRRDHGTPRPFFEPVSLLVTVIQTLDQNLAAGVQRLAGTSAATAGGRSGGSSGGGTATAVRPDGRPKPVGPVVAGGLAADPMTRALPAGVNGAAGAAARPGFTPSGDRIGRNDQCWCGSGLKYKKCHGR